MVRVSFSGSVPLIHNDACAVAVSDPLRIVTVTMGPFVVTCSMVTCNASASFCADAKSLDT